MDGQVLGGGVVVLVAVALWLIYLLPSWHGRHLFNAAERNAVRLNQALRVLAETSETPQEVRLELTARAAVAQQRLAKQAQAEREQADLDRARAELSITTLQAKADAAAARERAAAAAQQERSRPEFRRAQARRRARITVTAVGVMALALAAWGGFAVAAGASPLMLWSSVAVLAVCAALLQRMSSVQRRVASRSAAVVVADIDRVAAELQDVSLASDAVQWTPRELPRPLTSSAGSRAATVLDEAEARAALRRAAQGEAMRERAERLRPPSITAARAARRDEEFVGGAGAGDDVIEAHVRRLLERRASGQ